MADRADAWEDNVGGEAVVAGRRVSFYVDRACIFCGLCHDLAPGTFRVAASEDHDVVWRQPADPDALRSADHALRACPVEAIGDDG